MMPISVFAAAYQRLISTDPRKQNAGPAHVPDRRSLGAVMSGCHYFSPVSNR
jgi:hypothetical protein